METLKRPKTHHYTIYHEILRESKPSLIFLVEISEDKKEPTLTAPCFFYIPRGEET